MSDAFRSLPSREELAAAIHTTCYEGVVGAASHDEADRMAADRVLDVVAPLVAEVRRLRAAVDAALHHVDRLDEWCRDRHASAVIAGSIAVDLRRALADPGPTQRPDTDTKETP